MTKAEQLAIENEVLKARVQDLVVMILNGRDTYEDEPVRQVSQARFMKALTKARKRFAVSEKASL